MAVLCTNEIDAIETALAVRLPTLYRKLLIEIGPGRARDGAEIYHPGNVREHYESFFDDPGQLFNPYFPFGCDNRKQELWVIDAASKRAAAIWHETVPDDWPEEEWLSYEEWLERHLEGARRGLTNG